MPSASITSTILGVPVVGASRNDAVVGSVVTLASTNVHTTYSWTFAYKPPGSAAAFSGSAAAASPGTFTVDLEGPYLIRLTADLGLGTETTQYVRVRYPTVLGGLELVAAGEGYGGAIPVPVDQTPTGWTDTQNTNLMALLGLVSGVLASGDLITVDPTEGFGDYTTIQAAINAAVADGATAATPFVVQVRPGLYVENVTFASGVYVLGSPGTPPDLIGVPMVTVRGAHTVPMANIGDRSLLAYMTLENITSSTNATVLKTGTGSLTIYQSRLVQSGLNVAQGPALRVNAGTVLVVESTVTADSGLNDDRSAITQPTNSTLTLQRSTVVGPTGLTLNSGFDTAVVTTITNSSITSSGAAGIGILSDATVLTVVGTQVNNASTDSLSIHPGAGAFASGQVVTVRRSTLVGDVTFDTTGIVGATALSLGSSEYGALTYPGGAPATVLALTNGTSLNYDPTLSGIAATNVQDAIDEVHAEAVLVRTLDDAYDGGVPNSGGGRIIVADQGSVRIVDAPISSDPPAAGATNGRLEVVSSVKVGAIGAPEIAIDPNPYGAGAAIVMGNRVVPNNNPWSAGTTMLMGNSTGNPLYRNYDLRVQTKSSPGGGTVGRLILQGGDGLPNGVTTPDGSSVYIQAGSAFDATAVPGNVYISYGSRTGGASGSLILVRPDNSTAATLTAAGACANPIGVNGSITFATNMGAVTLNVAAADTRAAVITNLSALEGITAVDSGGGIIRITTDHLGANAEIYFLTATAGVNAAIGGFDGQVQVNGTYAQYIDVQVSADQEVSFGVTGAVGPLIYNADTGKLTVPGIIDPTAVVFEDAGPPSTGATEGAIFVSDGTAGLVIGHFYYRGPSDAVPLDLSAAGAVPTLSAVLASGNTTGGSNIIFTSGDTLVGEGGGALAGTVVLRGGTAGVGVVNGGLVQLRPGAGFGGGTDGYVLFSNAAATQGVRVSVTGADTISFDTLAGGGMPLVYNASTGKLDVPGLIDPTGLVLTQAAAPATGAAEGALFVSDGSGGLTTGVLYFRVAGSGASSAISGGAFVFPLEAAPSQIANGAAVWDSNDFLLTVGDGVGRKTMVDTTSTQTLTNKTLTLPSLLLDDANNNSVQDVVKLAHTTSGVAAPGIGTGLQFSAENSAGTLVDAARVSGFLENVTPGAEIGDLGFYTRTGGVLTLRWVVDGEGDFTPVTDDAVGLGESAHRIKSVDAITFRSYNAVSDANPIYGFDNTGFFGGAGGASPPNATLTRIVSGWSMNLGLQVGGNVTRNEASVTFGTTRTNAGGGSDGVTVRPADAVAAAASSQPGSAISLLGSNAAATGAGNFSAAGGAVTITAGNSAAVNIAQTNGTNVTITGGTAASGAGGGAATGGGVAIRGSAGVAGGSGGDVQVQPGALNGGGSDGRVVFSINGAGRTPTLLPQADNQGIFGANNQRWATFFGVTYNSYNGSGDANPTYRMDNTGFSGGPGAAGALDVTLTRISSGTALWNMNLGLRVGGNVTRNEASVTFGTTRTNNGGGTDGVTVQPAGAVAGASSAQSGSQLSLFGSNAAATGPGNFSASGGQVVIQAGNSAAVNIQQMNGPNVVVQGGNASSGAGGGPAKGGGVYVVGVAGVAGGDGGDVNVQSGQLNGGGKDGAVIFSVNGAARTPQILPQGDNQGIFGANNLRWNSFFGITYNSYNGSGDANPIYRMDNTGFSGGPGAAGALDVTLTRINAGGALWNMNLGLRVGGNVIRHEGQVTFGATRTNAGAGDAVTVQPSTAVAAAASAQPGGQLNLNGSNAAATGAGNFSASGGQVIIQAGNSAAVNIAQVNGPDATIQGGNASSGAGGGPAKGGGVGLLGVAGVAGGDGGDVNIKPGQLQGAGKDGAVVFTINGAARTPNLLPRATNEGLIGTTTTRWASMAFRDENSSGQKTVGFVSKVSGDSPYSPAASDYIILYDPTGGASTVNLPAAATNSGRVLQVKHSSASGNTVTLDGNAAETIDGNLTLVLNSYQSVTLICNGTNWFIL